MGEMSPLGRSLVQETRVIDTDMHNNWGRITREGGDTPGVIPSGFSIVKYGYIFHVWRISEESIMRQ